MEIYNFRKYIRVWNPIALHFLFRTLFVTLLKIYCIFTENFIRNKVFKVSIADEL